MKTAKQLLKVCLAVVCSFFMTSCSGSPSGKDAEQVLRQRIESESGDQIKLVSIRKTDGQSFEVNGIKGYKMEWEAEVEFERDGSWLSGGIYQTTTGLAFKFSATQPKSGSWAAFANDSVEGGRNVHKGDHAKITGTAQGEKMESGWKFQISHAEVKVQPAPGSAFKDTKPSGGNAKDRQKVMMDLFSIYGAQLQWVLESESGGHSPTTAIPSEDILKNYMPSGFPKHPSGGKFIIHGGKELPESTTHGVLDLNEIPDSELKKLILKTRDTI